MPQTWRFDAENCSEYINMEWWKQFQDPVLDELMKTALQNNQDLKVATAAVLEFYAQYRIVASQFCPQVSLQGNFDRNKFSEAIVGQAFVPRVYNLFSLLMNMSYEVDFWGRIRNATDSAKADFLGQVESRRTVILTLVTSLAGAYIQLKEFDAQLVISKETYESRVVSWNIAIARYKAGLVSEMEVKQAESEANSAEVQIKNFEILIGQQEDLISVLLGEAPGPILRSVPLTDLALPVSIPSGLPSQLLENRPDIVQAELAIISANAQIGVARAAFFPTISLTGLQGKRSTSIRDFLNNAASLFDYDVQAFQELYTGGRLTYQVREAQAKTSQAVHTYLQTILTAFQEVEDALIAYQKNQEKLVIQKEQVSALALYLKLALLRYNNGQNDYLTVLDAESSLFDAQLSLAQTQADIFLSLINLYKALGQGWDVEEEKMDAECETKALKNS